MHGHIRCIHTPALHCTSHFPASRHVRLALTFPSDARFHAPHRKPSKHANDGVRHTVHPLTSRHILLPATSARPSLHLPSARAARISAASTAEKYANSRPCGVGLGREDVLVTWCQR